MIDHVSVGVADLERAARFYEETFAALGLAVRNLGVVLAEQTADGKHKYYWSNFGPEVSLERLVEYAHRRHWVEQYHEEAKGLLGWDQYQGRL